MNSFKKNIIPIIILAFYILEGISKYYLIYKNTRIEITRYLRLLIFILIFFYFVYKRKYTFFIMPIILFLFFLMGQYAMSFSYLNFELIIVFSKYLFVLFLLEFSYEYFKNNNNKPLFKAFNWIIIINFIFIFLGILFKIHFLKTYYGERFGYNGLFITSATATYFYMVALFYVFMYFLKHKKIHKLSLFVIIPSFIIGTKSIYLFISFLVIYYFIFKKPRKYIVKNIVTLILVPCVLFGVLLIFIPSFLRINKAHGLLSAILSYRDLLYIEKTLPFVHKNWQIVNYLFGGQGLFKNRTQMGFVDLFTFFGIVGFFIYLYAYYKTMFREKINLSSIFIIVSFGIVVFLGGNFFYSATIAFYLIILQQILYDFHDENL